MTGKPWPDNPFVNANNRNKRYVYNYGHRNVQAPRWRREVFDGRHGQPAFWRTRQPLAGRFKTGADTQGDPGKRDTIILLYI